MLAAPLDGIASTKSENVASPSVYIMLLNVTKDDIKVRMAAVDQEIWPTQGTRPAKRNPPKGSLASDFVESGKEPMTEIVQEIYREFNERNGTSVTIP